MATPNGKGGWDLSDADIAEMQAMGMVAKDEPHDSSDTGTTVPIQRWHIPLEEWQGAYEVKDGPWVTHADHLEAVDEARTAALREALALVREREADLLSCHKDDECRAYARIAGVIAYDIQSELIDGGDTR